MPAMAPVLLLLPMLATAAAPKAIPVSVDARLELAGIAQWLSASSSVPSGFARPDIPYVREAAAYFAPFREHPAARLHAAAEMASFKFDDRSQVLLRLSAPPELKEVMTVPYALADQAGGRKRLEAWLESLRGLARDSDFPRFLERGLPLLRPKVEEFRAAIDRMDYLGKIEDYAGIPLLGGYSIYLSAFDSEGGVANYVAEQADGATQIYSVVGPKSVSPSEIDFWSDRVPGTLWHESAHGILDALADVYAEEISRSSQTHHGLGWDCYGLWQQCVRENVVRAVMLRLMERELGPAAAADQLDFEGEKKYPYLGRLLERLKEYEGSRRRYPTLADFYPELLKVFPQQPSSGGGGALPAAPSPRTLRVLEAVLLKSQDPFLLSQAAKLRAAAQIAGSAEPQRSPMQPAPRRSLLFMQRGIENYRKGRLEDALNDFDSALALDADDPEALMSRGVACQALKRLSDAMRSYDRAIAAAERLGPGELLSSALSSRASLWLEKGDEKRAAEDLEAALASSPPQWAPRAETERRLKRLARP